MSIESIINNDIKQAMLSKERDKLEALRAVKAAILLEKTKKGHESGEVTDTTLLPLLQRLVKQRKESAEIYKNQNRADLAETELFQAVIIEKYLPQQLSEEEIKNILEEIISSTGASGMKDMGKVMGMATKKMSGKADNRLISTLVREMLA